MFNEKHYVPVLKWKRGEQRGLADVAQATRDGFTPLIEVVPIANRAGTDQPVRTPDAHVDSSIEAIVDTWGTRRTFFLDAAEIAEEETEDQSAGNEQLYADASAAGLQFVPVVRLQSSQDEIAVARAHRQRGVCLRLLLEETDVDDVAEDVEARIESIELGVDEIDLIIDLGSIQHMPASVARATSRSMREAISDPAAFRTMTVIASNFPASLSAITADTHGYVPRNEWIMWSRLYDQRQQRHATGRPHGRMPTFGDYGIQHPAGVENLDMRVIQPAAAIRYTLEQQWIMFKGRSIRMHGGEQFRTLANALVHHPDFYGADHCAGCAAAIACANGGPGALSLEAWRRHGTTHHITVAVDQVQALPDF